MATRRRLDLEMARRGLAPSREGAQRLIMAGRVRVNSQPALKADQSVDERSAIALVGGSSEYASRGGVKLAAALDHFGLDPAGRQAMDVGASTCGFTDVLLRRGAASVIALDVGHGQLDWRLRNDPRVLVRERVNARALTAGDVPHPVDLVTIDVSFISLKHILPALPAFLSPGADIVALIKPQFEAGRDEVGRHGIIRDPAIHDAVIARVTEAADALGLRRIALAPAAITGATGNQEFFLHLKAR